jgi:regulatory protein
MPHNAEVNGRARQIHANGMGQRRAERGGRTPAVQPGRVPGTSAAWHPADMAHPIKPAGPAPTATSLRDAALRHLARFATTEAGLTRVLDRRVQLWGQRAAAEGQDVADHVAVGRGAAREVARALVAAGAVNDEAFAAARATRLARAGRSRRAIASHLAAKGVGSDVADATLPDASQELPAALAYARRRRIGPFRSAPDEASASRDMGALARAGFSRDIAERALAIPLDEAEMLVIALKRG